MTSDRDVVYLDGSYGEGGGQLVRTAVSLAALTGIPIRIDNVRARRPKPGLSAQHVTAVRAAAEICQAKVGAMDLGSRAFTFEPTAHPQPGYYRWDIGTAGAITLLYQAVLWPLAFANGPSEVTLVGGTHVEWSPPANYVQEIYLPLLGPLTGAVESGQPFATLRVERWGWYPRGGGVARGTVQGNGLLRGLSLKERGSLRSVRVLSATSNLPAHIGQRQADRADFLIRKRGIEPRVEIVEAPSGGQGTVVFVLVEYQHVRAGFTSYGRIRKPAEKVAEEACQAFFRYHERRQPIDEHLGDQLLLPLAVVCHTQQDSLSQSEYAVESVTQHLVTQAWVIGHFFPNVQIEIQGQVGQPGTVRIAPGATSIP
jgi:RNA 3'-terminal phosphate cyclase (ATP)